MSRKLIGIFLLLGLAAGAWVYYGSSLRAVKPAGGLRALPAVELKDLDGKTFDFARLRDHVLVVHFWASWCPPCLPELPEVLAAAKKLPQDSQGREIRWIFVSGDESAEKARSVLKNGMLPDGAIALLDPEQKVADRFGTYQYPETYVITRDQGIAQKWIGAQDWSGAWGKEALAGLERLSTGATP